jgi:putative ABC transport system permease protein
VRAPLLLRRQPAVAVAVAVTAALLAMACAALPLYLASAASAAVISQTRGVCASQLGDDATGPGPVAGVNAAVAGLAVQASKTLHDAGADPSDLGPAVVTMSSSGLGARRLGSHAPLAPVQLATRTGQLRHITVVSSAGGSGAWIPNDLAASLGVRAGQRLVVGHGGSATTIRVAGIYRSLVGTALLPFWCTQTAIFGLPDSNFPPPPVILVDQPTFLHLLPAVGVHTVQRLDWQRFFVGRHTLGESRRAVRGARSFTRVIGIGSSQGPEIPTVGHVFPGQFRMESSPAVQLVAVVNHAAALEDSLRGSIGPVSLAGGIVAILLVGLAGSYWVDRRRIEVGLLGVRGVGPGAIGVKAALETFLPVVVGALAGWGLANALVPSFGPSDVIPMSARLEALELVGAGALAGLLLIGVVAAFRSRGLLERPVGRRASAWTRVPIELVGIAAALWAWRSLGQVNLAAVGAQAPRVPAGFLVFPLLFLLSMAALAGRCVAIVLSTGRPERMTRTSGPAVWLAVRRLASGPQLVALLMLSISVCLGVFVYAAALTKSQERTLQAKAAVFVGSDVSAQLAGPVHIPADLASVTTEVGVLSNGQVGDVPVKVIAIDPSTFDRAAFWDSSFASQSLSSLLRQLSAAPSDRQHLAVLEIASDAGLNGTLNDPTNPQIGQVHLSVAARAKTFPGEDGSEPLLVTTRAHLAQLPVHAATQLWVRSNKTQVLDDLDKVGDVVPTVVSTADVVGITTFAAVTWTFAYLQAFGVLIGVVTVGGLLLFLTTRARARGLAYVLSRRMGLRRVVHVASLAAELGVVLSLGAVVGGGLGWLAVEMAGRHLNALPGLQPDVLLEVPLVALLASTVGLIGVWLLSIGWAQHAADRTRPAELMRLDA